MSGSGRIICAPPGPRRLTCPQAMRRNSRLSCAGVNSAHPVSPLGRRPRGLRLMEEVQQLPLSELSEGDRKSTRLNSSHLVISYAVFCLKKKKKTKKTNLTYNKTKYTNIT